MFLSCTNKRNIELEIDVKPAQAAEKDVDTAMLAQLKKAHQEAAVAEDTTIIFNYGAISCGCAQWSIDSDNQEESKKERFFILKQNTLNESPDANWNGKHLPYNIKLTGSFSKEKLLPIDATGKMDTTKASIFWYKKITYLNKESTAPIAFTN